MPRLIDADAFFDDFPELSDYEYASQEYEVDAEPVVRCRDCKFYWKNDRDSDGVVCLASPRDDAFCSEGERREDSERL